VLAQINGKVSGLAIAVPSAVEMRLARSTQAIPSAMKMWKPTNGENAAATPMANPSATACAEPDRRTTRFL
jgi:hypothetical protein